MMKFYNFVTLSLCYNLQTSKRNIISVKTESTNPNTIVKQRKNILLKLKLKHLANLGSTNVSTEHKPMSMSTFETIPLLVLITYRRI